MSANWTLHRATVADWTSAQRAVGDAPEPPAQTRLDL